MPDSLRRTALAAVLLFAALPALAADYSSTAPAEDKLGIARKLIASEDWIGAIKALETINDSGSADWNNLMGFSHRKAKTPDYVAAERYYDAALRIDPGHRSALEYSGELYLMLGNLPKAEQRLAALDKSCFLPCEEFSDLKKAIARYKANGNKFAGE